MEENRGRNVALPSSDQEVETEDACRSEVTRMEIDESGDTVDSSSVFSSHNGDARLEKSAGWTNEKHDLYLDYLEASFVEKLHNSILPSQGKFWRPFFSHKRSTNTTSSSDQVVPKDLTLKRMSTNNNHHTATSHSRTESFEGSTIEGSDQNFVDEEENSSITPMTKDKRAEENSK